MPNLKNLMIAILNEIEISNDKIINVRGGRGYGVGHPHSKRKKVGYGIVSIDDDTEQHNIKVEPVKVSKVFSNKEKEDE